MHLVEQHVIHQKDTRYTVTIQVASAPAVPRSDFLWLWRVRAGPHPPQPQKTVCEVPKALRNQGPTE